MALLPLFGRDHELGVLNDLIDRAPQGGGALVLRGEAGIGKSSLLAASSHRARDRGMRVLGAAGVQCETHLPFAGLHQLLRPILDRAEDLPAPQRAALLAAFGMSEATPELFLIALAALDLLADAAADSPLLLVAEDAQWLDGSTCDVLAFVARRLASEPIALLIAIREGYGGPLEEAGLPELRLQGLDRATAGKLLDDHGPGLAPAVRQRLLEEAAGNPLALVELPDALRAEQRGGGTLLPPWLPLTARLERAFAARVSELPAATRSLLLVAAVDDGGVLSEVLDAAATLSGAESGMQAVEALAPAVAARLVEVDELELRFRHPLVRSAIHQAASVSQRHAAHAALAKVLAGQPDRRVWHRAASIAGPDEEIAAELEKAAAGARQRGGIVVAVAALERAAKLSDDPARRGGRLLRAAELAFELGRRDLVLGLLREAGEPLELGPLERARLVWLREIFDDGVPGDPAGVRSLVDTVERSRRDGDTDLAMSLLLAAAMRCWWADPGEQARGRVVAAAERMGVPDEDPRLLAILGVAAPVERGAAVIDRLSRWAPDRGGDPGTMRLLGAAAGVTGAFAESAGFLTASVAGLRAQGRLGWLAQVLVLQAWAAIHLGSWDVAKTAAEEGGRLARETAQPLWAARARAAEATLAGLRGEQDLAEILAAEAERAALPTRASAVLADVQWARGLTALGGGRFPDAFEHLRRMFDPADPAHHLMKQCWAIGDLAEGAIHGGYRDAARALLEELEPVAARTSSPRMRVAVGYARPLLAADRDAEPLYQAGLRADLTRWPFARARLQLAFGAWLRRQRRVAESRAPLRAAREAFDALGVDPWCERARQELRAAGEASRRRAPEARDTLTPQELQIAQMAAEGMSNREIGQKLYLSHRTVGSHLYRIFPKLGITSRAQLRAVLASGVPSLA